MTTAKILIVEDENIVARIISHAIRNLGYEEAAIANSGEEALEATAQLKPDLVLMDIYLAGEIDGIEAAQQIRDRFRIPVVYLTAFGDIETVTRATMTDPFGFIIKPFQDADLRATIAVALRKHQVEREIERTKAEAQANSLHKSDLLSTTSHELRNSVSVIKSSSDLLDRYSERLSEAKKQRHLQKIQIVTEEMLGLLNDLLTLNRVESGRFSFNPILLDLDAFCRELAEEYRQSAKETHQFVFHYREETEEKFPLVMDGQLLKHILTNLLNNAIKYSPQGGKITLDAIRQTKQVRFHVRDSGIGISPEDQQKLFQTFYRASNVGTIPGTGLGLAIVKHCVDLHGGAIAVESQLGAGTTFTVTLPLSNACPLDTTPQKPDLLPL